MTRRGRPQLGRRGRRLLVLVHILICMVWTGVGATMTLFAMTARWNPDGDLAARQAYLAVHVLDLWLVPVLAFAALITGLLLCWLTPWGFTRHYWVLTKLVLTVAVIAVGAFGLGVWVASLALGPDAPGWRPTAVVIGGVGNLAALIAMTVLSHYKPRGLTPWSSPRHGTRRRPASTR